MAAGAEVYLPMKDGRMWLARYPQAGHLNKAGPALLGSAPWIGAMSAYSELAGLAAPAPGGRPMAAELARALEQIARTADRNLGEMARAAAGLLRGPDPSLALESEYAQIPLEEKMEAGLCGGARLCRGRRRALMQMGCAPEQADDLGQMASALADALERPLAETHFDGVYMFDGQSGIFLARMRQGKSSWAVPLCAALALDYPYLEPEAWEHLGALDALALAAVWEELEKRGKDPSREMFRGRRAPAALEAALERRGLEGSVPAAQSPAPGRLRA